MDCDSKSGTSDTVTHSSSALKEKVTVAWSPKGVTKGSKVTFRYSVVERFDAFWVDVDAEDTVTVV